MPRIFPEKARHSVLSGVPTGPKLSQEKKYCDFQWKMLNML
jgi:hypothetical protein